MFFPRCDSFAATIRPVIEPPQGHGLIIKRRSPYGVPFSVVIPTQPRKVKWFVRASGPSCKYMVRVKSAVAPT